MEEDYSVLGDNQIRWVSVVLSGRRHQMTQLTAPTLAKHHGPGLPVHNRHPKSHKNKPAPSRVRQQREADKQTASDPMAEPSQHVAAAEPRLPRVTIQFCTQCKVSLSENCSSRAAERAPFAWRWSLTRNQWMLRAAYVRLSSIYPIPHHTHPHLQGPNQ